ncbi:MAG: hypothetical protein ACLR8Y_03450 [Alistipes indistinctus]
MQVDHILKCFHLLCIVFFQQDFHFLCPSAGVVWKDLTYNDGRYMIATVQQKTSTPPTPHFRKMPVKQLPERKSKIGVGSILPVALVTENRMKD